jgi:hypothetical protein
MLLAADVKYNDLCCCVRLGIPTDDYTLRSLRRSSVAAEEHCCIWTPRSHGEMAGFAIAELFLADRPSSRCQLCEHSNLKPNSGKSA